jgi:hypothetical protein
VQADNKEIVLALREIAHGKVLPSKPLGDIIPKNLLEKK